MKYLYIKNTYNKINTMSVGNKNLCLYGFPGVGRVRLNNPNDNIFISTLINPLRVPSFMRVYGSSSSVSVMSILIGINLSRDLINIFIILMILRACYLLSL